MKLKKITLMIFSTLPFVVNSVALFFLPDRIPAHYGANFIVDRYGNKFEVLIFPPAILVIGFIFLIAAHFIKENLNKKITLNIGLAIILLFNALNYFLLYIQANSISDINSFGFNRFFLFVFGILLIFMGNLMPMSRRNTFLGLRTKWSMKNDFVWKKCQLFSGVSMIVVGIACFVLAFVYPEIFLMIGIMLLVVIVDVAYSYLSAKKYENNAK